MKEIKNIKEFEVGQIIAWQEKHNTFNGKNSHYSDISKVISIESKGDAIIVTFQVLNRSNRLDNLVEYNDDDKMFYDLFSVPIEEWNIYIIETEEEYSHIQKIMIMENLDNNKI